MATRVDTGVVAPSALGDVFALCHRALPRERFAVGEIEAALFGDEQPAVVRGDPRVGVVATVRALDDDGQAFVRLLVVDPEHRNRGVGRALLGAAEADVIAGGARSLTVGSDAPFFLFPGVPAEHTAMLCLLERCRFARAEANFNMRIDLTTLGEPLLDTTPVVVAPPDLDDDVRAFADEHYPHWSAEAMRALRQGSLLVRNDGDGSLLGFCAVNVNRAGTLGPIAVRPDRVGSGDGEPLLLGALHHLRLLGADEVDVLWIGPVRPYARVGGSVSRVFFVHRKTLDTPS